MTDDINAPLFTPVQDRYGPRLALVFGNQAPNGECPYFVGDRCHHCDIGAGEGRAFTTQDNVERFTAFRQHYKETWGTLAHLVVYNSGSTLNPREMPTRLCEMLLEFAASLPLLRVISFDSRESFIRRATLVSMAKLADPDISIRPILGLETANDSIRNGLLEKQMSRAAIERAVAEIGAAAKVVGLHRVGLDVNLVIGGPGTNPHTIATDAASSVAYMLDLARPHGISLDFNLHAYYPSVRGRKRFPHSQRCDLQGFVEAAKGVCDYAQSHNAGAFIGWQDEEHDIEPMQREEELGLAQPYFDVFNRTQDRDCLSELRGLLNSASHSLRERQLGPPKDER